MQVVVEQTGRRRGDLILDRDGTVRLSTLPEHEGASQATEPFFLDGSSRTTVQNAYDSSLTGPPTVTVAHRSSIRTVAAAGSRVLAANLGLERIDRIILERTGLGSSGRRTLSAPDGDFIQARLQPETPETGVALGRRSTRVGRGKRRRASTSTTAARRWSGVYRWLAGHGRPV